jgi:hypothetical protein
MVRDKRLAITSSYPISKPLRHRCLYRGLHCLGLCHLVSCPFEENDDARLQKVAFRSKPGFTSSPYRMSLFGITTLMFAMGIITLVLSTMLGIRDANLNTEKPPCDIYCHALATTSFTIVRLCDAFCHLLDSINRCSGDYLRFHLPSHLRLAHGDYLEQG